MSKQLTIAIVTYHQDFTLLERCLTSIKDYCNLDQIHSIKVVLNDLPTYIKPLSALLEKFPGMKLELVTSHTLEPVITEYFNWNTQQLFKILVSNIIETEWYLIHDCKDYYVDKVDFFEDCFTKDNRAYMKLDHTQYYDYNKHGGGLLPFNLAHEIACKVWGHDPHDTTKWHLPTTTPFFVKTQMMKDMVEELRSTVRGFLPYLFNLAINEQRFCTEFLLFSAYCFKRNQLADYCDLSANRTYYQKINQSKDKRISFPACPTEHEKYFEGGNVWVYEQGQWLPATN